MLAELEEVEILERDCLGLFGEIVDGNGQHVELKFPLQQCLDLVAVDVLAEWGMGLPLFGIFVALGIVVAIIVPIIFPASFGVGVFLQ